MPSILNATTVNGIAVSGDNSGVLALQTNNGTTAVTITTGQNVGIGTTSPGERLQVQASGSVYGRFFNGTTDTYIGATGGNIGYLGTVSNHAQAFYTNNTERMRINAGAPILCLAGGNTSATGTGIAFPATQSASSDANTLDDYEEGTFTPSLAATGGSLSVTYGATRSGNYTKIGNVVSVRIALRITAQSGGSGSYTITGLPFAASNPGGDHLGVSTSAFESLPIGSTEQLINVIDSGTTAIRLLRAQNNAGWNDYTPGSAMQFFTSFTYAV